MNDPCSVPDCPWVARSHGLCYSHAARLRRTGNVRPEVPLAPPRNGMIRGVCSRPDCGRPHSARGLCRVHYRADRRAERRAAIEAEGGER